MEKLKEKLFYIHFFLIGILYDILFSIFALNKIEYSGLVVLGFNLSVGIIFFVIYKIWDKIALYLFRVYLAILTIFYITEIIIYKVFGNFLSIFEIIHSVKQVYSEYSSDAFDIVLKNIYVVVVFILIYIFVVLFEIKVTKSENSKETIKNKYIYLYYIIPVFFLIYRIFISPVYISNIDFTLDIEKFGLVVGSVKNAFEKEEKISDYEDSLVDNKENNKKEDDKKEDDKKEDDKKENRSTLIFPENSLNIDFDKLEDEKRPDFIEMNNYLKSLKPTNKNKYTGIFEGKNLILICAEAFSYKVIDEQLTPTLYRLYNNGFRFENFYQPAWGGSTSSGEFSFLTGIMPYGGAKAMRDIEGHDLCFTMGNELMRKGYQSIAFHSGNHTFYDRDKTHTYLGFEKFIATGNGMEEIAGIKYPGDTLLIEKTLDYYYEKRPFCYYYMTMSGHAWYNNDNSGKVKKNIDRYLERYGNTYSRDIKNYICYQLELEDALTKMLEFLEKNEILDDTVICMTSDHYPYGLTGDQYESNKVEYKNYLEEYYEKVNMDSYDRDKNSLIIWSGCLENKYKNMDRTVTDVVSSIDILPTLLNLFNLKFDSRLLVGRDVFSNATPFVAYLNGIFITDFGKYDLATRKMISKDGHKYDNEYTNSLKNLVRQKILFSKFIIKNDYYAYLIDKGALDIYD